MCKFQDGAGCLFHRLLDTFTLNFTQPDPSRQEMNKSTYAECDPINNTDPTGLNASCAWIITTFVGGMASYAYGAYGVVAIAAGAATGGIAMPAIMLGVTVVGVGGAVHGMMSC